MISTNTVLTSELVEEFTKENFSAEVSLHGYIELYESLRNISEIGILMIKNESFSLNDLIPEVVVCESVQPGKAVPVCRYC